MNIGMLSDADWYEFQVRFAGACSWMQGRALLRELLHLRSLKAPTPWQQGRLAELESSVAVQDLVAHYAQQHADGMAVRMVLAKDETPILYRPYTLEPWPQVLQQFPYSTRVADLMGCGEFRSLYCVAADGGEPRLYGVTR